MTYAQTIEFLYQKLPMYHRIGAAAYRKDLTNIKTLCKLLGNPHLQFKSIHVAGTNGKGSTSHTLAAILQTAGYTTGLYTSPHLHDFRERVRINGKPISQKEIVRFVQLVMPSINEINPSFFEITTALAFWYFAQKKIDVAIIETGLGGRLDSTNIITPQLSIITNISLDHQNLLGDTLPEIATEKAGIIKPDVPIVIGETQPEIQHIFIQKANHIRAQIKFADALFQLTPTAQTAQSQTFQVRKNNQIYIPTLTTDLAGSYQKQNLTTVFAALQQLERIGYLIDEKQIVKALKNVQKQTGLQGRWQTISQNPTTIVDTAHNIAGITAILTQLNHQKYQQLHWVFGMVNDKDIQKILEILPKNAIYYFCAAQIPRALSPQDLQSQAKAHNLNGNCYQSVAQALAQAKKNATPHDFIMVGGSTFIVAEALK